MYWTLPYWLQHSLGLHAIHLACIGASGHVSATLGVFKNLLFIQEGCTLSYLQAWISMHLHCGDGFCEGEEGKSLLWMMKNILQMLLPCNIFRFFCFLWNTCVSRSLVLRFPNKHNEAMCELRRRASVQFDGSRYWRCTKRISWQPLQRSTNKAWLQQIDMYSWTKHVLGLRALWRCT